MAGQKTHSDATNGIFSSHQEGSRLFSLSPSSKPSIKAFAEICSRTANTEHFPLAASINKNVPIYELPSYSDLTIEQGAALQDEWYQVLLHGPGVFVTKGLFRDHALIDEVTNVFQQIIEKEKNSSKTHGDHFAGAGKNDRIWNSFSKHGLADPATFVKYYSNPYLALISSAWLGPGYRITAQVNNVKPGASPQVCHRDYHLGFMSTESCSQYPRAMQVASQCLTLQGAVAHVEVPLESGPTRLLPYSQTFTAGYMAYRLPEFNQFFLDNYVALPLEKGDGLFFNPALFHAAGENQSADVKRLANLLQISSAFGKPMETIDALPLVEATWDTLLQVFKEKGMSDEVKAFVAAMGEGYPFPTNLDRNPPRSENMAPESEQGVILESLLKGHDRDLSIEALKGYRNNTQA